MLNRFSGPQMGHNKWLFSCVELPPQSHLFVFTTREKKNHSTEKKKGGEFRWVLAHVDFDQKDQDYCAEL